MYTKLMNESLKTLIENRQALFKALIIPLIFLLIINIFFPKLIMLDGKLVFANDAEKYIAILFFLLSFIVNLSIAISVHRIILIKDNISPWNSVKTTKREWKFFYRSSLLGIISIIVFLIIFFFSTALFNMFMGKLSVVFATILSSTVTLVILSRFSMILPSIAIDEKMDFYDTWTLTKNYKFLSMFMVIIFPILISILIAVVYGLIIKFLTGISPHFEILYVLLNLFITTLVISCLSVTYSYIKEQTNKDMIENFEKTDS